MFILNAVRDLGNKVDNQVIGFQQNQQKEAEIQNARLDQHDTAINEIREQLAQQNDNRPTAT